jgi:transcriptional regulator with XRE-family HTH domain
MTISFPSRTNLQIGYISTLTIHVDGDIKKRMNNKLQRMAYKKGITNQQQLREKLRVYGIAEATARSMWLHGATTQKHYAVIVALQKVLDVPPDQFLEDPENLLPMKG